MSIAPIVRETGKPFNGLYREANRPSGQRHRSLRRVRSAIECRPPPSGFYALIAQRTSVSARRVCRRMLTSTPARDPLAFETSGLKMQPSLAACQCSLRQLSPLHPVEREPLIAGCRTLMGLGGLLNGRGGVHPASLFGSRWSSLNSDDPGRLIGAPLPTLLT